MVKPSKSNPANAAPTAEKNGEWKPPSKAVFDEAVKAIQAAQAKVDKAEADLAKAKATVSEAIIAFLDEHGRPADPNADSERTFPRVFSSLLGGEVQPVIRRTTDEDGTISRTGILKRFGAPKDLPLVLASYLVLTILTLIRPNHESNRLP